MENEPAAPEAPKQNPPAPTRDPLIRYSVFAALGCAGLCMVFTILYIFSYSLDSTLSFERHFDAYLSSANSTNMPTVLGLHMAQNRIFLQSCGMVAGIFFAFLGLALFLVGIQGTADATGEVKDYSTNLRRLAPGGIILLASMVFVGASAMHPIDFELGPSTTSAPTVSTAPPYAAPATQTPTTTTTPATQSQVQPTPQPANPQPARIVPQSAQVPTTTSTNQPAPATAPVRRPATRLALVNQKAPTPPPPTEHRFQP